MVRNYLLISGACLVFLFGCASRQKTDAPPPAAASSSPQPATSAKAEPAPATSAKTEPAPAPARTDGRKVKSKDGKISGEIFGTAAAKSRFAKLEIGMSRGRVEKLIGVPDDSQTHITGRSFQPFYFGGDTQRYQAFYQGEGQLTYSNSSMRAAPETLIIISVDRKATGLSRR
jgi:hypothetical protein